MMPVMDGFKATETIREIESKLEIKRTVIIALTANIAQEDRDKCLANNMDDFLPKPVRKNDLQETINKWLKYKNIN